MPAGRLPESTAAHSARRQRAGHVTLPPSLCRRAPATNRPHQPPIWWRARGGRRQAEAASRLALAVALSAPPPPAAAGHAGPTGALPSMPPTHLPTQLPAPPTLVQVSASTPAHSSQKSTAGGRGERVRLGCRRQVHAHWRASCVVQPSGSRPTHPPASEKKRRVRQALSSKVAIIKTEGGWVGGWRGRMGKHEDTRARQPRGSTAAAQQHSWPEPRPSTD